MIWYDSSALYHKHQHQTPNHHVCLMLNFPKTSIYQLSSLPPLSGMLRLPTSLTTPYHYPSAQTQLVMSDLPLSPLWKCWVLLPSWKCWVYYTYCYGIYALVSYHPMYTSTTYSNNYHRAPYSSPLPLSLSLRKIIKVCLSLRFSNSCLYTVFAWMTCGEDPVG